MSEFSWSEFLAGTATAKAFEEILRYYRRKNEVKVDMAQNARDIAEVHRVMETVVRETMFDRFIIFMGEDSAGVLAAGKNLYITAQYEKLDPDSKLHPIIQDIQRWKADTPYYDIYSEMLTKGCCDILTENMKPGKLKDIYATQGIKMAKVYHLMTTKDCSKVFFLSIASTFVSEASAEDRFQISSAVDRLADIFNRHKKFY